MLGIARAYGLVLDHASSVDGGALFALEGLAAIRLLAHAIETDDVHGLGIVDQTRRLFPEEDQRRGGYALDQRQVHVDAHERQEAPHHEVMQDAHLHSAAHEVESNLEDGPAGGGAPTGRIPCSP